MYMDNHTFIIKIICIHIYHWGHAVAELVQALRYKLEVRGLYCHWNFSLT